MANVTKPMALDETLQDTNTALSGQNLKLEGIITKLQGIIAALAGNNPIIGDTDISGIADGTVTGAIDELNDDITNFEVSDLHDVELANLSDGEILKYDATNQKWINGSGGSPIHNYSTSEQVVGTWIDGKPLYGRVFEQTTLNLTANTWSATTIAQGNMKCPINIEIVITSSSTNSVHKGMSGAFIDGYLKINSFRNLGLDTGYTAWVVLQYTKTTD